MLSEIIYRLPGRFSDNFGEPINAIFKLQEKIQQLTIQEKLILDYKDAAFTHPFFTLALPLLKINANREGKVVSLSENFNQQNVRDYMSVIKFPDGIRPDNSEIDNISVALQYSTKKFLPIVNFPATSDAASIVIRDSCLTTMNDIITNQAKLGAVMKTAVMYLIDEAINNIIDHSGDDRGYILAQIYPSKGWMDVCIADIGRTLLQTYQDAGKHTHIHTHSRAMHAALDGKSTKSNNVDRGFGISTSKNMLINGLRGKYFIYSGNVVNIHTYDRNDIIQLPVFWQGVYVAMRIPLVLPSGFSPANYYE